MTISPLPKEPLPIRLVFKLERAVGAGLNLSSFSRSERACSC
jgi:hypothetical protein